MVILDGYGTGRYAGAGASGVSVADTMSRESREANRETLFLLALGCLVFIAGGLVAYVMLVVIT